MIDRDHFYDTVRHSIFGGSISKEQFEGCQVLLRIWEERYSRFDIRWLAYCLATAYHETARTMQPIREYGRGKGKPYGRRVGKYKQAYYGRGYVQLTWLRNYRHAGNQLGLGEALAKHPDKVMEPELAARILFSGCIDAWFTKYRLSDFINASRKDYRGARRIVNGMDKASLIAGYAVKFEKALKTAPVTRKRGTSKPKPSPKPNPPAKPKRGFWASIFNALFGRK